MSGLTPFQTIGPFFAVALPRPGDAEVTCDAPDARPLVIAGVVTDGTGAPVPDAMIETWQADPHGRYHHPADSRAAVGRFFGLARAATDDSGRFVIQTVRPGAVPGPDGRSQAPHLAVSVFARGILTRLVTRIYLDDEPANATDPILALVPAERRATLIARRVDAGRFAFDIVLQGDRETVFFDV